jgi:predicted ATP-grasp superfamily ATP-dependent carboligase
VVYAATSEEFRKKYSEVHQAIPFPLVQEKIVGDGQGIFLLVWNGELIAAFRHRRLREKPPWGGVSTLRESLSLDGSLVSKSFRLLQSISWNGVAMAEYKNDVRDGRPKLMEINGRFWGSLQLAIDAGMNFPLLLYRAALGEVPQPQMSYRSGVQTRWLLGDLDNLLIRWRRPAPGDSRWRACREFVRFWGKDLHYETFRREDPAPGWLEVSCWLQQALHIRTNR